MIIIEGADLVGKTTLAKRLIREIDVPNHWHPLVYRRLGLLPGDWNFYDDYVNRMDHHVVYDRFFMSEWAYGRVLRGFTRLTLETMKKLDTDLEAVGAVTVLITADDNIIKNIHSERGDDLFKLDQILDVNREFMRLGEAHECKVDVHYHINDNYSHFLPASNPELINMIEALWYSRQCRVRGESE